MCALGESHTRAGEALKFWLSSSGVCARGVTHSSRGGASGVALHISLAQRGCALEESHKRAGVALRGGACRERKQIAKFVDYIFVSLKISIGFFCLPLGNDFFLIVKNAYFQSIRRDASDDIAQICVM